MLLKATVFLWNFKYLPNLERV